MSFRFNAALVGLNRRPGCRHRGRRPAGGAGTGAGRVLRDRDTAAARRAVLSVPRGGAGDAVRGVAARQPRRAARGGRLGARGGAGRPRGEPARAARAGTAGADAADRRPRPGGGREPDRLGRDGRAVARGGGGFRHAGPVRAVRPGQASARALGVATGRSGRAARGRRRGVAAGRGGPVHSRPAGGRGARAGAGRRSPHADPPPVVRPAGAAPDAGRDRAVRRRPVARRLRQPRRPVPRVAALRRAVGAPLDGPVPLQRVARQRGRPRHSPRVALPRLPDPRLQRRRALRPVDSRARGRRPAARARGSTRRPGPTSRSSAPATTGSSSTAISRSTRGRTGSSGPTTRSTWCRRRSWA